jgi:hypothetical protein
LTFFSPIPVNPKVETPPCLRSNRGSSLSVTRRPRGEILEGGRCRAAFVDWPKLQLFRHAHFP